MAADTLSNRLNKAQFKIISVLFSGLLFVIAGTVGFTAKPGFAQKLSKQKAHIKITNPKILRPRQANLTYDSIIDELRAMYMLSKDPTAKAYGSWQRYNSAPYLSATHGNRYINNYANPTAKDYVAVATGKKAQLPAGSILAKDSFTVTAAGKVYGGALFLMQKLNKGISPETGDWRYWMILPDGSVLGDTEADSAGQVAFCHACHILKKKRDFIFYIPNEYRK